jgi:hypothetical protein
MYNRAFLSQLRFFPYQLCVVWETLGGSTGRCGSGQPSQYSEQATEPIQGGANMRYIGPRGDLRESAWAFIWLLKVRPEMVDPTLTPVAPLDSSLLHHHEPDLRRDR